MLTTSLFSISHNVFKRPFPNLCGIVLNLSQTKKFRLFQTKRVRRRQFHRVSNHVEMYVNRIDFRKITYSLMSQYKKSLLNLFKSSIPDISTSMSTIFSVETLEKLCQSMLWRLLNQNLTEDFPVSKNR